MSYPEQQRCRRCRKVKPRIAFAALSEKRLNATCRVCLNARREQKLNRGKPLVLTADALGLSLWSKSEAPPDGGTSSGTGRSK
jgi:hypothetical protein